MIWEDSVNEGGRLTAVKKEERAESCGRLSGAVVGNEGYYPVPVGMVSRNIHVRLVV